MERPDIYPMIYLNEFGSPIATAGTTVPHPGEKGPRDHLAEARLCRYKEEEMTQQPRSLRI